MSYMPDGHYVKRGEISGWEAPSGDMVRTAYAAYSGQSIGPIFTASEIQAIDDEVKEVSGRLAALISDLKANGTLA